MAKWSETDIRAMLEERATEFALDSPPPETLLRGTRLRRARNLALAATTGIALVALVGFSVSLVGGSNRTLDAPGGRSAAGGPVSPPGPDGQLRLVDYSVRAGADDGPGAGGDQGITLRDLRRHADCMRSQGFALPAPTPQHGGGWAIIIDHPRAQGLDFTSRDFRQAWFVTCGPLGPPLGGDLVIGGPRAKLDRFIACMSNHGFDLPKPSKDTSGRYDIDEWQFDLTRTGIDTSTREWNRAMFVECAPEEL